MHRILWLTIIALVSNRTSSYALPQSAWAAECVAGYLGGVAKQACTHPFETVATQAEVQRGRERISLPWGSYARRPQQLYVGFAATALMNLPYAVVFHTTMYHAARCCRALPAGHPLANEATIDLVAGAAAASVACFVGVPLETVKHRMQVRGQGYENTRNALRTISRSGFFALYKGVATTLARNVPYNAVQFATFAALRRWGAGPLLAGASAGIATALVTTPIDVVNTRLQTQDVLLVSGTTQKGSSSSSSSSISSGKNCDPNALYRGPLDAVARMFREEGIGCFWRGGLARASGYGPSALVFFAVYEFVKAALTMSP